MTKENLMKEKALGNKDLEEVKWLRICQIV
jgi:hypothetical protein